MSGVGVTTGVTTGVTDYYLCVLDFEATCTNDNKFSVGAMEIIEFPSILYYVTGRTMVKRAEFHKYVKPTLHPQLTPFCVQLTGIQQSTVDAAEPFSAVYKQHIVWLQQNVPYGSEVYIATCGHWDLATMLPRELRNKKIKRHNYYARYINIKDEFQQYFHTVKAGSLMDMLTHLHMPFEGRLHSGIADTRNMARIMIYLVENGYTTFRIHELAQ